MNRKTRKGLGAILASVGVTTLLGVMSGTGVVRADVDPQPDPAGFDNAPTEADVTMKERCIWYVDGVASTITLTPTGDDVGEVYEGSQYSLAATLDNYVAWTSGNLTGGDDADAHAPCTFFGEQTGIEVDGLWSGVAFTAEAQNIDEAGTDVDDTINMGFDADITDPLTFALEEGTCRVPGGLGSWVVGPDIVANVMLDGSILNLAATDATAIPADVAGGNDKCDAAASVSASIPAGKTPLYAGKAYKFAGPTFTTDISIDTMR